MSLKERIGRLVAFLIFSIIVFGIVKQYLNQKEIKEFKKYTTGKIISFNHENLTWYNIKYSYKINDKIYTGEVGVSFFKCDNGRKGCVGSEFPVYYSSKNPQYSRIDLGKYEKYKTTVEFVK